MAADPHDPFVFFSASEDGTVRQFDARTRHACCEGGETGSDACGNVLIDFRSADRAHEHAVASSRVRSLEQLLGMLRSGNRGLGDSSLECKCIAVHPYESHIIAVGSSDAEIRVFDRRMLTLGRGNVPTSQQRTNRPAASTAGTSMGSSSGKGEVADYPADATPATGELARYSMPGLVSSFIPANVIVPQSTLRSAWYARRVPSDMMSPGVNPATEDSMPQAHSHSSIKSHLTVPPKLSTTHIAWSARGDRILASLNPDHVYSFDYRPSCAKACIESDDDRDGRGMEPTHHVPTRQHESTETCDLAASSASVASTEFADSSAVLTDFERSDHDDDDERFLAYQYPVDFVGNSEAAARRVDSLLASVQGARERGNECFKRGKYSEVRRHRSFDFFKTVLSR